MEFYQFCQNHIFADIWKRMLLEKICIFLANIIMQNPKREMVMENIEMVMEKSWIILFTKSMGILIMYRHLICRLLASYDLHRLLQRALLVLVCVI